MGKVENERLQRYFDGELSAEERARFEAEMTEDDRLRLAALGELQGLIAATLEHEAGAVDLWAGIEARQKKERTRRWLGRRMAGASAALMAVAAAALLLVFQPWHAGQPGNAC